MLTQITINKVQDMLAQITRDNFFYERTRTKKRCVLAQITTYNVQDVLAENIRDNFFCMKGQGQKLVVGSHKSKQVMTSEACSKL